MIHKEQGNIDLGLDHNEKIQANIEELHQPFPKLKDSSIVNSQLVHVFSNKRQNPEEQTLEYVNPFMEQTPKREVVMAKHEGTFTRMTQKSNPFITKMFTYLLMFYLLIIMMTHIGSDLFLDLIIALLLLSSWYFDMPRMIKSFMYKAMAGIVIALVFDIIWLIIYHKAYWLTAYQDSYSLWRFRRYIVVMTYILIAVRIIVLVVLFLILREIKTGDGQSEFMNRNEGAGDIYSAQDNKGYDPSQQDTFDPFSNNKSYPRMN